MPATTTGYGGLWLGQASPTVSNYAFGGTSTLTLFNSSTDMAFRLGNADMMLMGPGFTSSIGYGSSLLSNTTTECKKAGNNTYTSLTVSGNASQSAPLQKWIDNTSTVLAEVGATGDFQIKPGSSPSNT
jgi:hypothetical protein